MSGKSNQRPPPPRAAYRDLDWGSHRPAGKVARAERDDFKLELCNRIAGGRRRIYGHALGDLLAAGFVGVGFGVKVSEKQSAVTAARCIRVYVRRKLPESALTRARRIPAAINGLPTDVIALPDLRPDARPCGTAVGYRAVSAGTIGCVVEKAGHRFVLSNNHVLADCNAASLGDSIMVPAATPGPFATLAGFKPLDFTPGTTNDMDAALAELTDPASVDPRINLLGPLSALVAPAKTGLVVQKSGSTSQVTRGIVEAYAEDISFPYGGGREARFRDQVAVHGLIKVFSLPGDSGALVVTAADRRPVGLLFGSAPLKGLSFCSPIKFVLDHFGVTLVTA